MTYQLVIKIGDTYQSASENPENEQLKTILSDIKRELIRIDFEFIQVEIDIGYNDGILSTRKIVVDEFQSLEDRQKCLCDLFSLSFVYARFFSCKGLSKLPWWKPEMKYRFLRDAIYVVYILQMEVMDIPVLEK